MAGPDPTAPQPPARLPVIEAQADDRSRARPLPPDDRDHPEPPPRTPRSLREKMFDLHWRGWLQLALICLAVGVLLNLAEIDFFAPDFTLGGAVGRLIDGVFRGLGWLLSRAWGPLLTGVIVVAPFWLLWRFMAAWFRR